jgi:hypothetical protein
MLSMLALLIIINRLFLVLCFWMLLRNELVFRFRRQLMATYPVWSADYWERAREFNSVQYSEMMAWRNAFTPLQRFYEGTEILNRWRHQRSS